MTAWMIPADKLALTNRGGGRETLGAERAGRGGGAKPSAVDLLAANHPVRNQSSG